MNFTRQEEKTLWQAMENINDCWLNGNVENLSTWFHKDMIISAPDFQARGEGLKACIESFRQFTTNATDIVFDVNSPGVDLVGNTGIVHYQYTIGYTMNGKRYEEKGRDLFVFEKIDGTWLAIWRTMLPDN